MCVFPFPVFGQQTGVVSYDQIGVSFTIPEGWVGQETGNVFVMVSSANPGLIILIPHDQKYSIDELYSEAAKGLIIGGGTTLKPVSEISKSGENMVMGLFEGTIEYNKAKAFIIGKTNSYGNGMTIISTTTPELYKEEFYKNLGLNVANNILFSSVSSVESASSSKTASIEDWKYQLGGTRLTFMETYNSGGSEGGGNFQRQSLAKLDRKWRKIESFQLFSNDSAKHSKVVTGEYKASNVAFCAEENWYVLNFQAIKP